MFCPVIETTGKVLGARRLQTLSNLGALDRAEDAESAVAACSRVIERNRADLPFALVYLCDTAAGRARLAGAAGVNGGLTSCGRTWAPAEIALDDPAAPWPVAELTADGVVIEALDRRFADLPKQPWSVSSPATPRPP